MKILNEHGAVDPELCNKMCDLLKPVKESIFAMTDDPRELRILFYLAADTILCDAALSVLHHARQKKVEAINSEVSERWIDRLPE